MKKDAWLRRVEAFVGDVARERDLAIRSTVEVLEELVSAAQAAIDAKRQELLAACGEQ